MIQAGTNTPSLKTSSSSSAVSIKWSLQLTSIATLLILFTICFPGNTVASDLPFAEGEKLTYDLSWSGIKAGEASLEVHPKTTFNGSEVFQFTMTAKTTKFLDKFYKVRDRISGFADTAMTKSLHYIKKQREGRRKRDIVVKFDLENNTAHYQCKQKPKNPISIQPGTFDPLSAFYFTRCMIGDDTQFVERSVTDGKKTVVGRVNIIGKETITINDKKIEALRIEPDLKHVGGVFRKSKNAKIQMWVSNDKRRIPLMIKSKVVIGSFTAKLTSATGLAAINDESSKTQSASALLSKKPTTPVL